MSEKEVLLKQAEALRLRKEYLFRELSRIHESTKRDFSEVDAEVQLRACTKYELAFEKLAEEIITLNVNLPKENQISIKDFSTFQTLIDAIMKICYKAKGTTVSAKGLEKSPSEKEEAALPRLTLPVWEGDVSTWTDFKGQFDALVHSRQGLSGTVKLQYLRGSLRGEPLSLVNQYPLLEESYILAYEDLVRRYENKRRLASYHLNKILSYKNGSVLIGKEHIKFIEIHRSASTAIKQLGIGDLADYLLFELSYRNLSAKDQKQFDLEQNSDQVPSINKLLVFIEKIARSEELHLDKETITVKTSDKFKSRTSTFPLVKRGLVTTKRPSSCYFCKGDHRLFQCPEFLSLSVDQRKYHVSKLGCCVSCLYKHPGKICTSKYSCKICSRKEHNTILHEDELTSQSPAEASASKNMKSCNSCVSSVSDKTVLLGTALCQVKDNWGSLVTVRAVLDPGSEISIVTTSLANKLGLPKSPPTCQVEGIGRNVSKPSGCINLCISSERTPNFSCQFSATIMPSICGFLPRSDLSNNLRQRFCTLQLADPNFCKAGRVQLLLGADVYPDLLESKEPILIKGCPSAISTKFGYVILGRVNETPNPRIPAVSLQLSAPPLNEALTRFWEVEEGVETVLPDPNDIICEEHFQKTHERDSTGRFVVKLPFLRDAPPLGSNKELALKRLSKLDRRLNKNPELSKAYESCIKEYMDLDHISPFNQDAIYLLPHHAVWKESSSTTKCRVVFDCSAPDNMGLSLNDRLYRGPPLLHDISLLLLNFRFFKYCLVADIKMMYRMILIHPSQRHNLVFAWKERQYQMNRLPFGLKPAGYIAGRCVLELAYLYKEEFPAGAHAVYHNRYADDFCTGANSLEEAKELRKQLTNLLSRGGFEIRRWSSNVQEVLTEIPEGFREIPVTLPSGEDGIKVLGVMWDQSTDAFVVKVMNFDSPVVSKRTVLSYIAKIYDIMGFFTPTIFLAKHFMQRLWLQKVGWDDPLTGELANEWNDYANQLLELSKIKIPRHLCTTSEEIRLVGFADASERGMAAAVYAQFNGTAHLIKAKSKLAPLKTLTIPRLELSAALLLARLIKPIIDSSQGKFTSTHLYTDSTIVLAWLEHPIHELKTFVSNRVSQILQLVPKANWGHVSGTENPADLGSRGTSAKVLANSELWWYGPSFLKLSPLEWPEKSLSPCRLDQLPEIKTSTVLTAQVSEPVDTIIRRFSSLTRMQRVLGYIRRFITNTRHQLRRTPKCNGPLSGPELQNALTIAVRMSQREAFGKEISKIQHGKPPDKQLQKLSPFYDDKDQFVRVGGRLKRATFLPLSTRHPILLSKGCHLSELIVDHYHRLMLHSGPRATCAAIQRKFWITSLLSLVKKRIHRCITCYRLNAKPIQPLMADILPNRFQRTHCWASCALDFGGPILTRESNLRKSTLHKSYICVFVCLTTRAIHLEMVTDLTSAAFLAALHRFTARRSVPDVIYSDRGTNFTGAWQILRECRNFLVSNLDDILSTAAAMGTQWKFNVPYGPNFNGCAENGIKSAKALIKRKIGEQILTFEEFATLLCRVEQVLNSRPISFGCSNINDQDMYYLTPGHFITGRDMMTPPEETIDQNLSLTDRWKRVRQMSQIFWKTWSTSYLHELMQRHKWTKATENLRVGDLVYVTGMGTTPLSWPIGRIEETFVNSCDSTVRVARVRVRGRDLIRPISKLIVIPTEK